MTEDSKPVVQKICLRKKIPEKIDEEEDKAGGPTEARTTRTRRESSQSVDVEAEASATARTTRSRRTSQLFELQKLDESSPARSTRSRRSSQNFEALNEAAAGVEVTTRPSRSRRSSQNFEDVAGKPTGSKKPAEETITEEPETVSAEIDREKSGNVSESASAEGKAKTAADTSAETGSAEAKPTQRNAHDEEVVIDVITIEDDDDDDFSEPPKSQKSPVKAKPETSATPISVSPKVVVRPETVKTDTPKKQLGLQGSPMKSPKLVQDSAPEKTGSPKRSVKVLEAVEPEPTKPSSGLTTSPSKKIVEPSQQKLVSPKKSEKIEASAATKVVISEGLKSPGKTVPDLVEDVKGGELLVETAENSEERVDSSKPDEIEAKSENGKQASAVAQLTEAPEPMEVDDQGAADDLKPKSAEKENSEPESNKIGTSESEDQKLGRPISRKFWKSERDRFRSVIKSKGLKQVFSFSCL